MQWLEKEVSVITRAEHLALHRTVVNEVAFLPHRTSRSQSNKLNLFSDSKSAPLYRLVVMTAMRRAMRLLQLSLIRSQVIRPVLIHN
jgi:hypothetical protein